MITTTLSSRSTANKALFLQQLKFILKRYFYGGLLYTIFLLLVTVVPLYSQNYNSTSSTNPIERVVSGHAYFMLSPYNGSSFIMMFVVAAVPLLLSASLFGYLHNKRAVDFFHGLPVSRETLFLSRFTAGIIFTITPIILCQVLNLISYFIFPLKIENIALFFSSFFVELLLIVATVFVLFSIFSIVAVSCSTTIEQLGYSSALTILGPMLVFMWALACSQALYGYNYFVTIAKYLSPSGLLLSTSNGKIPLAGTLSLIVWLALGIVMLVLELKLYKKRQSETAEQLGRVTLLSIFVKIFAGTLGAFFITMLFIDLFSEAKPAYFAGVLIGAPLGYIIVEAITAKSFSTIKKSLPMIGLTTGIMLVAGSYLAFGGFGYETRVPKVQSVNEVSLNISILDFSTYDEQDILRYNGNSSTVYLPSSMRTITSPITLRTPQAIDKVRKLHESLIPEVKDHRSYFSNLEMTYKTKPFGSMSRRYNIGTNRLQMESVAALVIDPELVSSVYPAFSIIPEHIKGISITDKFGKPVNVPPLNQSQMQQLLEAVQSDLLKQTVESVTGSTSDNSEAAFLEFNLKDVYDVRDAGIRPLLTVDECSMLVQASDENTVALLKEWKLWPGKPDYSKVTKLEILPSNSNSNFSFNLNRQVSNIYTSLEKYDYWRTPIADPSLICAILDKSTAIPATLKPKNPIEVVYSDSMSGTGLSFTELYIDNELLLEILSGSGISAPYIPTSEELSLYYQVKMEQGIDVSMLSMRNDYRSQLENETVKTGNYMDLGNNVSVGAFFEKNLPNIMAEKPDFVKKAMYNTPLENESGIPIFFGPYSVKEDGFHRVG